MSFNYSSPHTTTQIFQIYMPRLLSETFNGQHLTDIQAAAILGNAAYECSGFQELSQGNALDISSTAVGIGWLQWSGGRHTAFLNWCSVNNLSWTSDEANYGYLVYELQNTNQWSRSINEPASWQPSMQGFMNSTSNIGTTADYFNAAWYFEEGYERPASPSSSFSGRENYAQQALAAYYGSGSGLPDLDARNDGNDSTGASAVASLSASVVNAGQSDTFTYRLSNWGPGNASASTTGIYRSTDATFDSGDTLIAVDNAVALNANVGVTDTVTFSTSGWASGIYYLIAVANYNHAINETTLGNNPSNAVQLVVNPVAQHLSVKRDFNNDGQSDILWQNTDGTPYIYEMNGTSFVAGGVPANINPGPGWQIKGSGDFNGDGKADILWQNTDGTPYIWEMNGTSLVAGGIPGNINPGSGWQIKSSGDFNGDGKADILWQNTDGTPYIWEMNGTSIVGSGVPANINPGPGWQIKGSGDFNGDGKADILWQNTDGTPFIWEMNGTSIVGGGVPGNINPGPGWQIKGSGDFNGDGKADILWQNTDGTPYIWEMNGTSIVGGGIPGNINPGPSWKIIGVEDFNGDGKSDILWQNIDGTPYIWEMNGTSMIGAGIPANVNPGTSWKAMG